MNKERKSALAESPAGEHKKSYHHYLKMVQTLEKLRRESDLELGPRLMDKILDAQGREEITIEEAMELTGRVHEWSEKLQHHFASQEYQMKKLLRDFELDDRRCSHNKTKK
jgi:predicted hydrolase (HD superfamily)